MKKHNSFFVAYTLLFISTACNNDTTSNKSAQNMENYKIHFPSDTINFTDQYNRKQGMWIDVNSKDKKKTLYKNDTAYPYTDSTLQDVIKMLNSKP